MQPLESALDTTIGCAHDFLRCWRGVASVSGLLVALPEHVSSSCELLKGGLYKPSWAPGSKRYLCKFQMLQVVINKLASTTGASFAACRLGAALLQHSCPLEVLQVGAQRLYGSFPK